MSELPQPIIDESSFQSAELNGLRKAFPIRTLSGGDYLQAVMHSGLPTSEDVVAHQEAVQELNGNDTLRQTIDAGLQGFASYESSLIGFIQESRDTARDYSNMRRAAKALRELGVLDTQSVDAPETPWLKAHMDRLQAFDHSDVASLLSGPLYYTAMGLRARDQLQWWMPRLRFRPAFSGRVLALEAGLLGAEQILPPSLGGTSATAALMIGMFAGMFTMEGSGGSRVKDMVWSRPTVYKPLRQRLWRTPVLDDAMATIGALDVANATVRLQNNWNENGHDTIYPKIRPHDATYSFSAKELKNPVLALNTSRQIVANNLDLGKSDSLTFLTGPNSGGKSTLSKAIIQTQILAQMGAPVVAKGAETSMADTVAYHVPIAPDLEDETGRFGFELKRVREILDSATPRSLVILDDCLDGTTHEERLEVLGNVMTAFQHLVGATLFSTHAHELVTQFSDSHGAQLLQVTFENDRPTYQITRGISRTSHANRLAERYGFTAAQVADEIRQKTSQTH